MKVVLSGLLSLVSLCAVAQNPIAKRDTSDFHAAGKFTVEAYIDAYYSYDFNNPGDGNRPYFVSMARHNEMTINLAFIDVKYSSARLRGRFIPGVGTYINSNNASEPLALRNIVEASAGIKLSKTRPIWIDFGVFGSPYTNEGAISKDYLTYTRSFAPEYVPYYLSGVKLSVGLSEKVSAYLYLLNGWQQIQDVNSGKSVGTQLEYRPNEHWLLNWNTYIGKENSALNPTFSTRYFTDFYFIWARGKWSASGCTYVGRQTITGDTDGVWWQANLVGKVAVAERWSVVGRVEYFDDASSVMITPITNVVGFRTAGSSLGLDFRLTENVLLRMEGRSFFSDKEVYERGGAAVKNSGMVTGNVTMWF